MSIYTTRAGATAHPEAMLDFMLSHFLYQSGVKDNTSGGDLEVTEQSSPNMSVQVATGYAFIKKSDSSKSYPVRISDSAETVNISANSSGNSRKDAIVLYINLGASPDSVASNVAQLTAVEGTAGASPTAPTDSDIETDIGASNPYIRLADVTVEDSETQIQNADIVDQRPKAYIDGTQIITANNEYFVMDDSGGTATDIIKLNSSDLIEFGQSIVYPTLTDSSGNTVSDHDGTTVRKPSAITIEVFGYNDSLYVGDGSAFLIIPEELNGMDLTDVSGQITQTAPTGANVNIQVHNVTDSVDMLSTVLSIDATETTSETASTPAVIDTANDDVATNDLLRIDIDAVGSNESGEGLVVLLRFAL